MNKFVQTFLSISMFLLPAAGNAAQSFITIYDLYEPDETTEIGVSDGRDFVSATWETECHVESPGEPDEFGEPGPPVITDAWTQYRATIPDDWVTESRGISFHIPGYGWTGFHPMSANPNANYELNLWSFPRRNYPNPDLYTTSSGNRVMLERWWKTPAPAPSVAKLVTWDNDNAYWRAVGIDSIASTNNAFWRWMHTDLDGSNPQLAMDLDYLHRLTIRSRSQSGNALILDPEIGRISVNGWPVVTAANAEVQLSSAFVGKSPGGVNLALGATLRNGSGRPPQVLLGGANDLRTDDGSPNHTDHTQGVLIVGSTAQPGTNGLRILDDGTVLIRPRGGLQMAPEFQAGQQP